MHINSALPPNKFYEVNSVKQFAFILHFRLNKFEGFALFPPLFVIYLSPNHFVQLIWRSIEHKNYLWSSSCFCCRFIDFYLAPKHAHLADLKPGWEREAKGKINPEICIKCQLMSLAGCQGGGATLGCLAAEIRGNFGTVFKLLAAVAKFWNEMDAEFQCDNLAAPSSLIMSFPEKRPERRGVKWRRGSDYGG